MKIVNEKSLGRFASSGAPADKEGHLSKKGELNKGFQKRWFVLKGNLLFYYEKKGDREPIGVIVLEGCTIELCENADNFSFQIDYQGQHNRVYILSADSQELMESWMKALSCAGYEYVKLMVGELQSQLQDVSVSEKKQAVADADRDSRILSQTYADRLPASSSCEQRETIVEGNLPNPHQRINPFNNRSASSSATLDRDFLFPSNFRNSDTYENVFVPKYHPTFKEMHEEIGCQIKRLQEEWLKKRAEKTNNC